MHRKARGWDDGTVMTVQERVGNRSQGRAASVPFRQAEAATECVRFALDSPAGLFRHAAMGWEGGDWGGGGL